MKVFKNVYMEVFINARMQLCMYETVWKYSSMQVCKNEEHKYANIQVGKHRSMTVNNYACIQECKCLYASMHVCKYTSMKV